MTAVSSIKKQILQKSILDVITRKTDLVRQIKIKFWNYAITIQRQVLKLHIPIKRAVLIKTINHMAKITEADGNTVDKVGIADKAMRGVYRSSYMHHLLYRLQEYEGL